MTLRIDPEKNEVQALKEMTIWHDKRVLEIGCGNGRLTQRLANLGAYVDALDPNKETMSTAKKELPERLANRVKYKVGSTEKLKYPNQTFEIVIFSWVL